MSKWTKSWRRYRAGTGIGHEAVTLLLSIAVGLLLAPLVVYFVGLKALGPYANGGYLNLLADIFKSLAHGSMPFWLFAIAPYFAVWLLRIWRWSARRA